MFRRKPEFSGYADADGFVFYDEHPSSKGENARQALDMYANSNDRGEPFETVVTDLLADLFHLIASESEDPDVLVGRAFMHFQAEHNAEPVFN